MACRKDVRLMADQDHEHIQPGQDRVHNPVPVTPSRETERPEGLAFDVDKGTGLPGVPSGDQAPRNPGAAPARETGGGVGLALPGEPAGEDEAPDDERAGEH
jgi:hypothetical protein